MNFKNKNIISLKRMNLSFYEKKDANFNKIKKIDSKDIYGKNIFISNKIFDGIKNKYINWFIVDKKHLEEVKESLKYKTYFAIYYELDSILIIMNEFDKIYKDKKSEVLSDLFCYSDLLCYKDSTKSKELFLRISALKYRPLFVDTSYCIYRPNFQLKSKDQDLDLFFDFIKNLRSLFSESFMLDYLNDCPKIKIDNVEDFCFNKNALTKNEKIDIKKYNKLLNEEYDISETFDEVDLIF